MNQDKNTFTKLTSSTPDSTLVQLAVNGNQEAFNHLYERYFAQVYSRVSYLIPTEDIDDVTQEVLIAMLQSLKSFRGDAKFGTWLRVITNRHIANYYRKNKNSLNDGPGRRKLPVKIPPEHFRIWINPHLYPGGVVQTSRPLSRNSPAAVCRRF